MKKGMALIPKKENQESFHFHLGLYNPKQTFVSQNRVPNQIRKRSKAFWCTGSLLKASAEHICLSFKMNKFKILIPFLFFRTSFAERERSLEVHGEKKHTNLFLANFFFITKEVRVPYIEEESQEDRTGPLSFK